jgi:hypothetical protein
MNWQNRLAMIQALLLALVPASALAESPANVGVVTTLTGQATVARASLPQPLPLRFKDDVFVQDRISTAEKSIVRVLLGGKALVTVRELSVLTVTEELGRSTVDLGSGKIAVGVARQRMRPGEVLEIRTPNIVAAVRGTVLVVEIIRSSADSQGGPTPPTTNVHVIHGLVDVFPTGRPGAPPVQVGTLQSYSQIGGAVGTLRSLSREAAENLFADIRSDPQISQGPSRFMDDMHGREAERARALALAILPDMGSGGDQSGGGGQRGGTGQDDFRPSDNRDVCSLSACDPSGGSNGQGGGSAKSGNAVTTYNGQTKNFAGSFYSVPNGGNVVLNQPLLETTSTSLTVGGSLIDVKGTLVAADANHPFVYLDPTLTSTASLVKLSAGGIVAAANTLVKDLGGSLTVTGNVFDVTGNSALVTLGVSPALALDGSTLTNGTGTLLSVNGALSVVALGGSLLEEKNGAQVTTQQAASVNAALLAASLPLLRLTGGSAFTSTLDAVTTNGRALAALGPVAALDASSMTIRAGAGLRAAGNSVLAVAGDLFTLANRTTLTLLNGPLLLVSGNSSVTITGALLSFTGTGNIVSVTNNLCPCTMISGIPVSLSPTAQLSNISIVNPIRYAAGGTITTSPNAALIRVDGANSRVTILGR